MVRCGYPRSASVFVNSLDSCAAVGNLRRVLALGRHRPAVRGEGRIQVTPTSTYGDLAMDVKLNRRQFFKICATGLGGSSLGALGFAPTAALAEVREFKLLRTTETRNTC